MTAAEKRRLAKQAAVAKTAFIYCRVSTGRQAAEGVSLDVQEAACRAYCARMGLEVLGVHKDAGMSGKLSVGGRPGLAAVVDAIQKTPGSCVVVYSLSRLARSQGMIWKLLDEKGDYRLPIASATEPFDTTTSMGKAFLGMLSTFAQLESDLASERTTAALAYAKDHGTRLGTPGMIETVDERGSRVVDKEKAALVRQVQLMYAAGGWSHRRLADHLNAEGKLSVNGKQWHARTIRVALSVAVPEVA